MRLKNNAAEHPADIQPYEVVASFSETHQESNLPFNSFRTRERSKSRSLSVG